MKVYLVWKQMGNPAQISLLEAIYENAYLAEFMASRLRDRTQGGWEFTVQERDVHQ